MPFPFNIVFVKVFPQCGDGLYFLHRVQEEKVTLVVGCRVLCRSRCENLDGFIIINRVTSGIVDREPGG